jgi:hypothetical protein
MLGKELALDAACPGLGTALSAAGLVVSVANSSSDDEQKE